jgi:hypothetical protein
MFDPLTGKPIVDTKPTVSVSTPAVPVAGVPAVVVPKARKWKLALTGVALTKAISQGACIEVVEV